MRQSLLAAFFGLLGLLVPACGPAPRQNANHPIQTDPNAADPTSEVVCQDERTTGTNLTRTVCLTKEQINENRRAAQDWEKRPRNDIGDPRVHP